MGPLRDVQPLPAVLLQPRRVGAVFHEFGPHNRNFFHAQPTPDGRLIAIESTRINEDAGPIAVLKLEHGPRRPGRATTQSVNWDVLTPQVNNDGAPWAYGAFKYPFPLGGNRYVASYTLPAAEEGDVDYGLYTFTLRQDGAGTAEDPATITISDLTFLYNDPGLERIRRAAARPARPGRPSECRSSITRSTTASSPPPTSSTAPTQRRTGGARQGHRPMTEIAVIVGIPTVQGERNDFSANEFEKRALLGFAPVHPDGSFRIKVPADTPVSLATLDELRRGFVVKRSWIYVRPGEEVEQCTGCHEDRALTKTLITNPNPIAATLPPTDLNLAPADYTYINYRDHIGPIVENRCATCHHPTYVERDSLIVPDSTWITVTDTIPPPGESRPDVGTRYAHDGQPDFSARLRQPLRRIGDGPA